MEAAKKKRASRWSAEEVTALLTGVEANSSDILGSFSCQVSVQSKKLAWEKVTRMVSFVSFYCTLAGFFFERKFAYDIVIGRK